MPIKQKLIQILLVLLVFIPATGLFAQEIKIGYLDSLKSEVLQETRKLLINLPEDYYSSDKAYPVIYRLDGDLNLLIETAGIVQRLTYREEVMPEAIVVLIENTHRNRDMMPVNTFFFEGEPGADNFKKFIEDELFPYMSKSYRITGDRMLIGQSLSSLFTLYCFLTSPGLFDSYIASSAGFPGCEEYFINLTNNVLAGQEIDRGKIFLSYGSKDPLDPDGAIGKQLSNFVRLLESKKGIDYRYKIYPEEGHVPYQSLYHGLKFRYE